MNRLATMSIVDGVSTPESDAGTQSGASNTGEGTTQISDADKLRRTFSKQIKELKGVIDGLTTEITTLKSSAKPASDDTTSTDNAAKIRAAVLAELEGKHTSEVTTLRTQIQQYESTVSKSAILAEITDALDSDLVVEKLAPRVKLVDGVPTVVDQDGDPTGQSIKDIAAAYRAAKPFLFKASMREGADFRGSQGAAKGDLKSQIAEAESKGLWTLAGQLKAQLTTELSKKK